MFRFPYKVNFYDADAAGILFFANVYKIAHTAYENFLEQISPERNFFDDEEILIPIIHSEADYHRPILPGEEIEVVLSVAHLRESTFGLHYDFLDKAGNLKVKVETVHIAVSKKDFKKTSLPEDLRTNLEKHLHIDR